MNILVCVKQVRESSASDALWILNPADACAVEMALTMRQEHGGKVSVMTMGRASSEDMLRELIARGVDEAYLVTDPAYAGSDTLATARILHKAIQKIGPFDLILTGRRAVDGETALTPARLAQLMEWPLVTNVQTSVFLGQCMCETDSVQRLLTYRQPCILTVHEGSCKLRLMGILGMRRAKSATIHRLTQEELQLPADEIGLQGSPTRVHRVTNAPEISRQIQWLKSGEDVVRVIRAYAAAEKEKQTEFCSANRIHGSIWVLTETVNDDCRAMAARARALCDQPIRVYSISPRENTLNIAAHLCCEIRREQPAAIFALSTDFLRRLTPQLATILNTGITADCTDLQVTDSGLLLQIRPTFGGAQMAQILCPTARPQIALVRAGVLPPTNEIETQDELMRIDGPEEGTIKCLSFQPMGSELNLKRADLLLAGGAGVGSYDGFIELGELAEEMGGQLAATRAAVDLGYVPYRHQVGQTGLTVRPKIYLTFGISGAIQHLLGMKDSGMVISINTDPKAPIFHYSDFGLIMDWRVALQEIEEAFIT